MTQQRQVTRRDITDSFEPIAETSLRTVFPNGSRQPATTGANLMKVVEDYGQIEDGELSDEISKLEIRLARAQLKQVYIKKLQAVVDEFKAAATLLEVSLASDTK
jgi:hypothetical protein